ncbi:MAG: SLC13 family permease [Burkholderiales bacterium]|nr:SLC13 family permease [Burkholderiales bacterium]
MGIEHRDRGDDAAGRAFARRPGASPAHRAGPCRGGRRARRGPPRRATSRSRSCSASPGRPRSAGSARSSVRRRTGSSRASSSRPTARRCRSRAGSRSGCRWCCSCFRRRGCSSFASSIRCAASALEGGRELVEAHYRALGPLGPGERATLAVFVAAVLLWVTRPLLVELKVGGVAPLAGLTDAGIAIAAAMALFLIPADRGLRAMDWENARRLPWGVLVLFGGGLSLAAAVEANGVAAWLGGLAGGLGGWPPAAIVLALVAVTVFASEFTSNTAQVATMLPLVAAMAPALGVEPQLLLVACTLAASCAFMMPVGTPPNAIVFGAGLLTIGEMMRAGFWLNAIGIVVITGLALAVIGPLLAAG